MRLPARFTVVLPLALLLGDALRPSSPGPAIPASPSAHSVATASLRTDTLRHGRFGPVIFYRRQAHPSNVVLFVSGDGGWSQGVVRMAHELAEMDALVVGIDIRRYLHALARAKEPCSYPAADFESLSQWVQQKLGFPSYVSPILVGYSSGSRLVYATLAQSPPGTFLGGLSLGFCPELPFKGRFCHGSGLLSTVELPGRARRLAPPDSLPAPWILLQGEIDSTCPPDRVATFTRRIRNARMILLPYVGHGFGVESRWMPQFRAAFTQLARARGGADLALTPVPGVQGLPLVEVGPRNRNGELAVVISGDGGWAGIDRQIAETFASEGIPVVGLNSLQYLWKGRTPNQAGADLTGILRHYLKAWNASRVLLVGYSRGADVLPFMVSRLPADLRSRVELVALLGLSHEAGFEFHFADLLGGGSRGRPTMPEIRQLRGIRLLCIYGTDEDDSACRDLPPDLATVLEVPGGHHFGGAYQDLAHRIVQVASGS
jgi:type IV secretory pathway VirJ component